MWIQRGAIAQPHHGGGSMGSRSRADIALSRTAPGAQGPASTSWGSCQREENGPGASSGRSAGPSRWAPLHGRSSGWLHHPPAVHWRRRGLALTVAVNVEL